MAKLTNYLQKPNRHKFLVFESFKHQTNTAICLLLNSQTKRHQTLDISELVAVFTQSAQVKKIVDLLNSDTCHSIKLKGLKGSAVAMTIGAAFGNQKHSFFIIEQDKERAAYLYNDLQAVLGKESVEFLPSSYQRSIEYNRTDSSNILLRTDVLSKMSASAKPMVVITHPESLMEKVIKPEKLKSNTFVINKGDSLSHDFLIDLLSEYGFDRVDFVVEPGQYSVRGSLIDVFSFSDEMPFRLDFFGDDIESIRSFDIETQLTKKELEIVSIIPNIQDQEVQDVRVPISDFFPENTIVWFNSLTFVADRIEQIFTDTVYKTGERKNIELIALQGSDIHLFAQNYRTVEFGTSQLKHNANVDFNIDLQPTFHKKFELLAESLNKYSELGYTNYILSDNQSQNERLSSIFKEQSLRAKFTPIQKTINEGFVDNDLKICSFTDHQIFERYHKYNIKTGFTKRESITLAELSNLHVGDFVVHIDYGIGKFAGLQKVEINGKFQETIKLVYRDNDVLFVSIHSLHRISKYMSKDAEVPNVHKLGTPAWQKLKATTKSKVKDIAKDLIKLYAQRKATEGYAFSPDSFLSKELEASFMYEDTPDQQKATQAVKADMESTIPMDRLVCGDVGFGKTEVAIRAAFKAVADNKQVAVLVPTTILAMQHFRTFSQRLADFPCKIDYLSRMRSAKEQKAILSKLESGELDIVIGTHKLVGKEVKFKDLGLLIIDEEQKFGVSVKEKLKELKHNVDTLTLTATPIPRTLQFSLMGARDLSIISTPPPNRQPIYTEVHTFEPNLIKEAVEYEMSRGGQVFFIHNRIGSLDNVAGLITKLVPSARVITAHGQMEGKELEKIFLDFIDCKYDVLVATTIIEAGLDIPNANTIIIDKGENYGLSEMHQLRGRVGRSNKKAYCYIFASPDTSLTSEARRRLKAIEDFSELGSGFNLSLQDLDIRGAGNLLGAEQSGFIGDLGFETYQRILDEALLELKESELQNEMNAATEDAEIEQDAMADMHFVADCHVDTDLELLVPDDYVESTPERINLYRRIDALQNEEGIARFITELTDRFGPVPQVVLDLLQVVRIRWTAVCFGIEMIILKNNKMKLHFVSKPESLFYKSPQFSNVIMNVQRMSNICKMEEKNGKLILTIDDVKSVDRASRLIEKISGQIINNQANGK